MGAGVKPLRRSGDVIMPAAAAGGRGVAACGAPLRCTVVRPCAPMHGDHAAAPIGLGPKDDSGCRAVWTKYETEALNSGDNSP